MKKIVAILMVMIMVISVTVVLAGSAADNDTKTKEPVIIGFKSTPSQADKAMVRGHGGDITYSYTLIDAIAAKLPEQAIENIQKTPRVTYVEMDVEVHTLDAELDNSWGVKRIGAGTVHDSGNKGSGVKVAILDSGIDYSHPDLNDNYQGGYDYVNNDKDPMDDNGHGTHCAGIVAAEDNEDNGEGVVGVAPEAHLYAVKVLNSDGNGYLSDVIAGIQWSVKNGMQVISMSLGGDTYSRSLHKACDRAYDKDIVIVAAAGNEYQGPDTVSYPAKYDSVIAVAATDCDNNRASFSSTGPAVELAAPGVDVTSTWLDEQYAIAEGTSMACPHVAGTAALVIAAGGDVRKCLQDTADDLGTTGKDDLYGYGLVNADEAALVDNTPNTMHIASIEMSKEIRGKNTKAIATVTIVDADINPVEGATVSGHWSGLTSDRDAGATDANGEVALKSDRVKDASETFKFTVTTVTKDGWSYNPSANVITDNSTTAG
jgi:subtilisin family serine protease